MPKVSVRYFVRKNHSKKNLDSKYVNTVYKTEKETEHTVAALGKTYYKNDIAPVTEGQYRAPNLQDQNTPSASSSQPKRGIPSKRTTTEVVPSPSTQSPKPLKKKPKGKGKTASAKKPGVYYAETWTLWSDRLAYG